MDPAYGIRRRITANRGAGLEFASRWDTKYTAAFVKYNDYVKSLSGMNVDGAKPVTP